MTPMSVSTFTLDQFLPKTFTPPDYQCALQRRAQTYGEGRECGRLRGARIRKPQDSG
jgi:hypothetical protein